MAQIAYILSSVRHARELAASLADSEKNHFIALPSERLSMLDSYVKHIQTFSGASELMFCDALSAEKLMILQEKPEYAGLKNALKATPMIVITMLNDMRDLENNLNVIGYINIKNENAETLRRVTAAFYGAQATGGKMECEGFQPVVKRDGFIQVSAKLLGQLLTHTRKKASAGDARVTNAPAPVSPAKAMSTNNGTVKFFCV